ncbi:MAG TPA: hypothetical protein VK190_04590 [Pseudoneobacillus sp.]|nr:hypothetical protein [Pseudoneobacillus sp.]
MNTLIRELKGKADSARLLYKRNLITRDECREAVKPYIMAYNEKSQEVAVKYNVRPKFISFSSYIR